MNIKELIIYGTNILKENNIQDSNIKARVLLQYILQQDKNYLIINSNMQISEQQEKKYYQYIQELIQGKPLQYITNTQEFMGLNFYVDENVLIPQPDTEILVEETIKEIENKLKIKNVQDKIQCDKSDKTELKEESIKLRILDMCTGSGVIAISIAKHFHKKYKNATNVQLQKNIQVEVYGLDISEEALKIAEKNANTNEVDVTWFKSNMFKEIDNYTEETFDIIVSNPPYIETETINTLSEEVKQEPHIALDGGKDGLDFYRIIAKEGSNYLKENGSILIEIGYNQKESVTDLFKNMREYTDIVCVQDLARNDRAVKVTKC